MAGASHAPEAVAAFYPVAIPGMSRELLDVRVPAQIHLGGADPMCPPEAAEAIRAMFAGRSNIRIFSHAGAGHAFFNPDREEYHALATDMSLTNVLEMLKPLIGTVYDLPSLWENHAYQEFGARDADATIETMVDHPYVNHVPSMTGGTGRTELRHFYQHYFVDVHPDDYGIQPVSRTVGVNRIVDEMVVSFTHDRMMDYVLPGIAPTGRKVTIAATGIVSFRGDKIRHEHLYYDQASLLVQVGLLDPALFPVVGAEQAAKVLDPASVPANGIMKTWTPAA
jgi:carboxymethylenebutenolidase